MKYVVVLPYIYEPYFKECIATCKLENLLAIDNTVNNIGIMASHNLGVKRLYEIDGDWLIIMSAAIRFGEAGGLDFIEQLKKHNDHYVIHAASSNTRGGLQHKPEEINPVNEVKGWHLTAFKREVFDNIGTWDENFSPYGMCDIDMSLRLQKHYKGKVGWNTYPCDVHDLGMSHGINLADVKSSYPPRNSYFQRKWGREGGEWQNNGYEHPFDDSTKPLSYWPDKEDPLSIWQNEFKNGGWKYED